ncbi:MAG: AzlD family protein [Bacillota bacterium]
MTTDYQALFTIACMAVVTYATRAGGLWLMSRVTLSKRTMAWLRYVPGTVLMAIVAPTVLSGGLAEKVAGLATALVAWRSENLLLALATGVGVVWGVRLVL